VSLVLFGNFTSIATPGLVTKCTVELTDVERRTLQQLSLKHRHRDFRIRATGLLLRARGLKVQDIARELEVSYQTLYDWAHVWREFGVGGLLVGHTGGRPLALPEAMLATAIKAASAESMTLGQIAQRIESVHGEPMPCRVETLAVALKAGRLLVQACPVLAQKKRDERDFAMKASTLSKLQKAGRDRQCRLIYFDEAGFSASPSVQRGWSPRGKHHCVTPNPHCRRSVMGALDVAVNNAGTQGQVGPITDQSAESYAETFDTNVLGVVLSMKHEVRVMQGQGSGSIVNISSTYGHEGAAGASVYGGSKHAVEGITKSVALEVAKAGIRVNAVAPGPTDTGMLTRFTGTPENKEALATGVPMGRLGLSEEVASAIVFIASAEASYITGHVLNVDGGHSAT
jgi:NAD(P)-dependent dehydrogenase (short-subunit alcohol dehydrogenase family)/transposase